jgi:hypothetical protein
MNAKKHLIRIFDRIIIAGSMAGLLTAILLAGCNDEIKNTITYTVNEPVYMSVSEFRTPPPVKAAQEIVSPGKICLYGDYIFINEIAKGFHVIDNRNPSSPQPVAFIELPGNIDLAINNNWLYADSYIDLVWFDLSNPAQPTESGRLPQVFPNVLPPTGNNYPVKEPDYDKGIIVGWEVKTITEEEEIHRYYPCRECLYTWEAASGEYTNSGIPGVAALTGSMARFAVYDDFLYVVTNNMLKVFPLAGNEATKGNEQYLSWNVETVFAYNGKLFLGTTSGLLIYGLDNPAAPVRLSSLSHVMGCDPVVVQGDYAYVTIRGGNACGQNLSQLDVVNIRNPSSPYLAASFGMKSPYGLGIDGNTLFVCDEGLKIFDATNPLQAGSKLVHHFTGIDGFDVIPYNNVLILIGSDGLHQYDYSDIQDIKLLSALKTTTDK